MSNNISRKLFKELQNGNESAYETIFKNNISRVLFFIEGFVKSRAIAEEIAQDAFLRLWNYRDRLVAPETVVPFLYTVAKNGSLDYIRKANSHRKYIREQLNTPRSSHSVVNELEAKQLKIRVKSIVDEMPQQRKRVFRMSRIDELEVKEIADKLDISPKTVYAHLDAAVKYLKDKL